MMMMMYAAVSLVMIVSSVISQTLGFDAKINIDTSNDGSENGLQYPRDLRQSLIKKKSVNIVNAIRDEINVTMLSNDTLAPKYLRLAFHDCVGGCDGCVDMTDANNRGLDIPIDALQPIVSKYEGLRGITRADVWTISAEVASQFSAKGSQALKTFSFPTTWVGRVNCENRKKKCFNAMNEEVTCSATTGPYREMPSPDYTTDEVLKYFSDHFGFNAQETAAIMGGHNLGVASRRNSGFDGSGGWHNDKTALNRGYYAALNINTWNFTFVNNSGIIPSNPSRYQWNLNSLIDPSRPPNFMLNADMALVRDMSGYLNSTTGEVSCRLKNTTINTPVCPFANKTLNFVLEYRLNETKFYYDFRDALSKMLTSGYDTSMGCATPPCRLHRKKLPNAGWIFGTVWAS